MVHEDELAELQERAHQARVGMAEVCRRAGVFRQSWHRAKKRGRAEYGLVRKLEGALDAIEKERA